MAKRTVIYVLKCEGGKYYVGKSTNLERRIREHEIGKGSYWTKLHRPLRIHKLYWGDARKEMSVTAHYMDKYGINNVRGGEFSKGGDYDESQVKWRLDKLDDLVDIGDIKVCKTESLRKLDQSDLWDKNHENLNPYIWDDDGRSVKTPKKKNKSKSAAPKKSTPRKASPKKASPKKASTKKAATTKKRAKKTKSKKPKNAPVLSVFDLTEDLVRTYTKYEKSVSGISKPIPETLFGLMVAPGGAFMIMIILLGIDVLPGETPIKPTIVIFCVLCVVIFLMGRKLPTISRDREIRVLAKEASKSAGISFYELERRVQNYRNTVLLGK